MVSVVVVAAAAVVVVAVVVVVAAAAAAVVVVVVVVVRVRYVVCVLWRLWEGRTICKYIREAFAGQLAGKSGTIREDTLQLKDIIQQVVGAAKEHLKDDIAEAKTNSELEGVRSDLAMEIRAVTDNVEAMKVDFSSLRAEKFGAVKGANPRDKVHAALLGDGVLDPASWVQQTV